MNLTTDELRTLYLTDLTTPDTTHDGRVKVRHRKPWEPIQPFYKTRPLHIDVSGDRDIWVWSDQHFGHKNVIKYCNRPYPTPELMNACMLGNYQNIVKPDDIVIFGGDVGFMSETRINEVLDQMPGYKIQIVGNHDLHRDGKLYNLNFDERHLCLAVDIIDPDIRYQLLFTHYPMNVIPNGYFNYHGHIHHHPAPGDRHVNICVEHTGYKPILLKDTLIGVRTAMALSLGLPC